MHDNESFIKKKQNYSSFPHKSKGHYKEKDNRLNLYSATYGHTLFCVQQYFVFATGGNGYRGRQNNSRRKWSDMVESYFFLSYAGHC